MCADLRAAIPRGAYAPRSCAAITFRRKNDFCDGAAGVVGSIAPRGQCTASNADGGRRYHGGLPSCAAIPRGAYAPRSCAAMRNVCRRKTIFAMHKRTSDQERRVSARRGFHCSGGQCTANVRRVTTVQSRRLTRRGFLTPRERPRWAYAHRSWLRDVCSASKSAIRDAQTHIRPRAAGVRSSCAVLRAVTRATDGVPDRKAVIERASRPAWSSEVNMHSGWQNRWPKDFSSSVVQRSEHAQRMAEPLAEGFLVQREAK
jgi:hypothetical protein